MAFKMKGWTGKHGSAYKVVYDDLTDEEKKNLATQEYIHKPKKYKKSYFDDVYITYKVKDKSSRKKRDLPTGDLL